MGSYIRILMVSCGLLLALPGFAKTSNGGPHDGSRRSITLPSREQKPEISWMNLQPPTIVVVSYGRKSQDTAVNEAAVNASLKTILTECKPAPKIEYVDDVEPANLTQTLRQRGIPQGSLFLVNSHGLARNNAVGLVEGLDLATGLPGSTEIRRRSAEDVIEAILRNSGVSNIWLSACHGGNCNFFDRDNNSGRICLGAECGSEQDATADSPVFSKFSKLFCSAYGSDNCKLFNESDANHSGTLSTEEIAAYLKGEPRKEKLEAQFVPDASVEIYKDDCLTRGGSFKTNSVERFVLIDYQLSGQDHLQYDRLSNVKSLDPLDPVIAGGGGDFDDGVAPKPGKTWGNVEKLENGRRLRSLGKCSSSEFSRRLAEHLYGKPSPEGKWASCADSVEKWKNIPQELKDHCRISPPPPISDPEGYEENFPASNRKETDCSYSERKIHRVSCEVETSGVPSRTPRNRDAWGFKPFEPQLTGITISAPWCKYR